MSLVFFSQLLFTTKIDGMLPYTIAAHARSAHSKMCLASATTLDNFFYSKEGVCFYTREQFNNYRITHACNAFVSRKVQRLASFKPSEHGEGIYIIAAATEASQYLSKAYHPSHLISYC